MTSLSPLHVMAGGGGGSRVPVASLNPHLTCALCSGYFADATTLVECLHSFCRSCIVRYLTSSSGCPVCDVEVDLTNQMQGLRRDDVLQTLVYKLVPGLVEVQRKQGYRPVSPLSTSSLDDSEPTNQNADTDAAAAMRRRRELERYLQPEDTVSVCLQHHFRLPALLGRQGSTSKGSRGEEGREARRHYLLCESRTTLAALKRFVANKMHLNCHLYEVSFFFGCEVMQDDYTLADMAYIQDWRQEEPMTVSYAIHRKRSAAVSTVTTATRTAVTAKTDTTTAATNCRMDGSSKTSTSRNIFERLQGSAVNTAPSSNISRTSVERTAAAAATASVESQLTSRLVQQLPANNRCHTTTAADNVRQATVIARDIVDRNSHQSMSGCGHTAAVTASQTSLSTTDNVISVSATNVNAETSPHRRHSSHSSSHSHKHKKKKKKQKKSKKKKQKKQRDNDTDIDIDIANNHESEECSHHRQHNIAIDELHHGVSKSSKSQIKRRDSGGGSLKLRIRTVAHGGADDASSVYCVSMADDSPEKRGRGGEGSSNTSLISEHHREMLLSSPASSNTSSPVATASAVAVFDFSPIVVKTEEEEVDEVMLTSQNGTDSTHSNSGQSPTTTKSSSLLLRAEDVNTIAAAFVQPKMLFRQPTITPKSVHDSTTTDDSGCCLSSSSLSTSSLPATPARDDTKGGRNKVVNETPQRHGDAKQTSPFTMLRPTATVATSRTTKAASIASVVEMLRCGRDKEKGLRACSEQQIVVRLSPGSPRTQSPDSSQNISNKDSGLCIDSSSLIVTSSPKKLVSSDNKNGSSSNGGGSGNNTLGFKSIGLTSLPVGGGLSPGDQRLVDADSSMTEEEEPHKDIPAPPSVTDSCLSSPVPSMDSPVGSRVETGERGGSDALGRLRIKRQSLDDDNNSCDDDDEDKLIIDVESDVTGHDDDIIMHSHHDDGGKMSVGNGGTGGGILVIKDTHLHSNSSSNANSTQSPAKWKSPQRQQQSIVGSALAGSTCTEVSSNLRHSGGGDGHKKMTPVASPAKSSSSRPSVTGSPLPTKSSPHSQQQQRQTVKHQQHQSPLSRGSDDKKRVAVSKTPSGSSSNSTANMSAVSRKRPDTASGQQQYCPLVPPKYPKQSRSLTPASSLPSPSSSSTPSSGVGQGVGGMFMPQPIAWSSPFAPHVFYHQPPASWLGIPSPLGMSSAAAAVAAAAAAAANPYLHHHTAAAQHLYGAGPGGPSPFLSPIGLGLSHHHLTSPPSSRPGAMPPRPALASPDFPLDMRVTARTAASDMDKERRYS